MMKEIMKRQQVPTETTWNLEDLYPTQEAFMDDLKKLKHDSNAIQVFKGTLLETPGRLLQGIQALEELLVQLDTLNAYTELWQSEDATNIQSQELAMTFDAVALDVYTDITFFDNEIMSMSQDQHTAFFVQEKGLETYRTFIDDLYDIKAYKLSDDTEEALAALGEVTSAPYSIYNLSKATDMVFQSFEDGQGQSLANSFALFEGRYEFSEDPIVRKNAYASFNKTLKQYKTTYATVYATEIKKQIALSKLRGYPSVTHMLLQPHKVTEAMYHRQIDVIYKTLAPHMQKFAGLLKDTLGLDKVHFYDLKAPLDTTYNPEATYEEAKATVLKSLEIMGPDYLKIMDEAFDNRWVDYADNAGKATGAFCYTPYAGHPYILMTFQDNMRDAFTLTHELGHAGHFYLANKAQTYLNTEPSMYTIEAPSTMHEMLLGRHLLTTSQDPKMKKWTILQFIGTYYHNFVTHLLEAAFQRKIYSLAEAHEPLTAQLLCETKLEIIRGFWGDAVEVDEDAGMTWMRQPHYYMGLYPYTYSAGLTASTAVSEMIFTEGQPAVDRWMDMLKTGGQLKPLDLLKLAGMDFTTDQPVEKAVAYVGHLIDQLVDLSKA